MFKISICFRWMNLPAFWEQNTLNSLFGAVCFWTNNSLKKDCLLFIAQGAHTDMMVLSILVHPKSLEYLLSGNVFSVCFWCVWSYLVALECMSRVLKLPVSFWCISLNRKRKHAQRNVQSKTFLEVGGYTQRIHVWYIYLHLLIYHANQPFM